MDLWQKAREIRSGCPTDVDTVPAVELHARGTAAICEAAWARWLKRVGSTWAPLETALSEIPGKKTKHTTSSPS